MELTKTKLKEELYLLIEENNFKAHFTNITSSLMMAFRSATVVVIGLVCIIDVATCLGFNSIKFRQEVEDVLQSRRQDRAKEHLQEFLIDRYQHLGKKPTDFSGQPYPDLYLEQPLDHFDPQETATYMQRYWVNKNHWKINGGPVFLFIGGEGGLSSEVVQAGEHYELAVKYNAMIFAVEHRFYGKSFNANGLELKNMQYLSSQQALADLASFHVFAMSEFKLSADNVWICFGGSYPGSLSAWFRIKYPHLVYGAIASSAPVLAVVDNQGYNIVVANSLSDPVVNGSQMCAQRVKEAFSKIDSLLDDGQYEQVSQDFKSCTVVTQRKDVYQLVSNVADIFLGTVQYNNIVSGRDVTTLCDAMTKSGEAYDNLKDIYRMFLKNENCTDNLWENFIRDVSNTSKWGEGVGIRQWLYQTCTQFGYYQTCEADTSCLFSHRMTLQPNLALCQEVFGVEPISVYDSVEFTNSYYGGSQPAGTRIVFVNGSIDPWHALSILKNISSTETAIYINGTAHCANMESDEKTDPLPLRQARKEIDEQIGIWLDEASGHTVVQDTNLYFKPLKV